MSQHTFDKFTVFFTTEKVFLDRTSFPLGQLTTDILNLGEGTLEEIDERINRFLPEVQKLFQEKTDCAAHTAQEYLNGIWDLVFELPVYRDLDLDISTSYNLFLPLLSDPDKWQEVLDIQSEGRRMFDGFLAGLKRFSDNLRNFRGQTAGILELYFEQLPRRNQETYAKAFTTYFSSMRSAGSLFYPGEEFEQSYPARICFVPIAYPTEQGKPLLAEKTEFRSHSHFLYTEFYRGLTAGNVPHRCRNCGWYFLLTEGYNTWYCNNIAPEETERTCRKVGGSSKSKPSNGVEPSTDGIPKSLQLLEGKEN